MKLQKRHTPAARKELVKTILEKLQRNMDDLATLAKEAADLRVRVTKATRAKARKNR